ncbi:MAG TPA: hypothetical protein GXZ47_02000 [Treponema sp.]|nr:hypothetical protein [Treponema sp.]
MKRQNHLFELIIEYQNIRLAFIKAIRGKRNSTSVLLFCRNIDKNLAKIRKRLETLNPNWGHYRSFTITDPKERIISAAPLEERIMHHAIMNILEPIFERQLIFHTYACRKGKGTHVAVLYAFRHCKSSSYFLKLDVRKYFDSIDHIVLKQQIFRLIKDTRTLFLLVGIIDSYHTDSGKGLPIGNLTSQFFANLYLSSLDHYILEVLKPAGYVRYMDDFVLWGSCTGELQTMLNQIELFTTENLKLTLKTPVLGKTTQGLPFLGFLIKARGIYLLRTSKSRMRKRVKTIQTELSIGKIDELKAAQRANSINAAVLLARTQKFRATLWNGSGFGPRQVSGENRLQRGGSWNMQSEPA